MEMMYCMQKQVEEGRGVSGTFLWILKENVEIFKERFLMALKSETTENAA